MNIFKNQWLLGICISVFILFSVITGCKKANIVEPSQKISDSDLLTLLITNSITPGCYHISDSKYEYKSADWMDNAIWEAFKTMEPFEQEINDCDDITLATLVSVRKQHRLSGGKLPLAIGRFSYLEKNFVGHVLIIGIADNKRIMFWEPQNGRRAIIDTQDISRCYFYEW